MTYGDARDAPAEHFHQNDKISSYIKHRTWFMVLCLSAVAILRKQAEAEPIVPEVVTMTAEANVVSYELRLMFARSMHFLAAHDEYDGNQHDYRVKLR